MSRCVRSLVSLCVVLALSAISPGAGAAASGEAVWQQFGRTATHHNDAPQETAFTQRIVSGLAVAWTARFGQFASGFGGAAAANGSLYVGGNDGVLSAFSLSGCAAGNCTPLWQGVTENGINGTPAIIGSQVLVASTDHFLYAFPASGCGQSTCKPRWRGQMRDAALGSVAVSNGIAYVGDFGGRLYAFPVKGCGKAVCPPAWTGRGGPDLEFNTTPTVARGHVYVGAFFNTFDDVSGRMVVFPAGGCGKRVCQPEWTADVLGQVGETMAPLVSGATVFMGSGTRFSEFPNSTTHLFAFAADGCGSKVCTPIRSYATGDSDLTGGFALSHGVLYASSQSTPDPNTVGVLMAFPASGCKAAVCQPLWTGINFGSGSESPPVVAGDVVFVAKGPASGFPVDEAVLSYPVGGCGEQTCLPLSFTQVGTQQFYLGAPIAVADHTLFVPTEASVDGADDLVALQVKE